MRDATKVSLMHLRCPLLTFCHKATEVTSGAGQLPASSSCSQFRIRIQSSPLPLCNAGQACSSQPKSASPASSCSCVTGFRSCRSKGFHRGRSAQGCSAAPSSGHAP